jgi:hypothetical protein
VLTSSNLFAYHSSPNEKVIFGIMRTNSNGKFLTKSFAKSPNVEFTFICYHKFLAKIIAEIEKMMGKKPQGFADVRKTLNTCCYNY